MIKILLSLLLSSYLMAETPKLPSSEIWSWGNEYYPMEMDQKNETLISVNCKTIKCLAFKAFNEKSKKQLTEKDLRGGKNPGAVICTNFFRGSVMILRDVKQNENSFCKFADGSLISASGLIK